MHVKHTSTKEKLERRLKSDREKDGEGGGLEMLKILTKLTLEENEILRSL